MIDREPRVVLDTSKVRTITERSDFDPHQNIHAKDLGEDWGDGFFVQEEPVLVQRNKDGSIARTTPISEVPGIIQGLEDDAPPVERTVTKPGGIIPRNQRDKLVQILSMRLLKQYKATPPSLVRYNPIYDGIPKLPAGSPQHLQPLPGTPLYPASEQQVFDWLVRDVIGPRIQLINKQRKLTGYAGDVAVRFTRKPMVN